MLQAIEQDQASSHTRKQHNTKRTRKDGVRLQKHDGQVAYIEYAAPFGVLYLPSIGGSLEQIQCRSGDSSFSIEGSNLWPLFEDLQAKLVELLQESDAVQAMLPVLPSIQTITVRLWV